MTDVRSYTLPNGCKVLVRPTPDKHILSMMATVRWGGRDDEPDQAGLSNLMTQLLVKGTRSRTAKQRRRRRKLGHGVEPRRSGQNSRDHVDGDGNCARAARDLRAPRQGDRRRAVDLDAIARSHAFELGMDLLGVDQGDGGAARDAVSHIRGVPTLSQQLRGY